MIEFCTKNRVAMRAHISLCKGDVLSLPILKRDDMTPAQAAIKFNVDRNVCALFGVDNKDQIVENFKVQTEERFRHLPPVNAAPPAKSLLKMYPMWNLNNPGMMMKDGMLSDTGIMRKEWDTSTESWKYYLASSAENGATWADRIAKMSEGQTDLMVEIEEVIVNGIKKQSTPCERRQAIHTGLSKEQQGIHRAASSTT